MAFPIEPMIVNFVVPILDTTLAHYRVKQNFREDITDIFFMEVKKNHMPEYRLLEKQITVNLNQKIACVIKKHWNLENVEPEQVAKSGLIKHYTSFRLA